MSKRKKPDPTKPELGLLVKLGSVAVHTEELLSPRGHEFDRTALIQLLEDHEVKVWIEAMDKLGFMPKKR